MLGLLAPTVIAIGVALALGGSLRELLRSGIRGWPALLAAFAVELVLYNPPVDRQVWAMHIGPWIWLATKLVLLAVLIWNAAPATGARLSSRSYFFRRSSTTDVEMNSALSLSALAPRKLIATRAMVIAHTTGLDIDPRHPVHDEETDRDHGRSRDEHDTKRSGCE